MTPPILVKIIYHDKTLDNGRVEFTFLFDPPKDTKGAAIVDPEVVWNALDTDVYAILEADGDLGDVRKASMIIEMDFKSPPGGTICLVHLAAIDRNTTPPEGGTMFETHYRALMNSWPDRWNRNAWIRVEMIAHGG